MTSVALSRSMYPELAASSPPGSPMKSSVSWLGVTESRSSHSPKLKVVSEVASQPSLL